ncbi:MAG: hypothetical protein PHY44_05550 [Lachnospiraceae bacterium]|nr:hypothetical protein [Lachnospiraceae bacterium]
MKKLIGKLSFLSCALVLALPISASAATIETVNGNSSYAKITQSQLLSQNGVTIKMNEDKPVQVEFLDGSVEEFTYTLEDISNTKGTQSSGIMSTRSSGIRKRATVTRGIKTASLELWGDATWSNRSVSFDDDVYLDYWGASTSVDEDQTWVTKRTGSNNNYAKARTRGVCTTTEPATGVQYNQSFDFEIWLDPANSTNMFLHINK